jgi:hypothetical protein
MFGMTLPFRTVCSVDAPLRLVRQGWHRTFNEHDQVASFWHRDGSKVAFVAADYGLLHAEITADNLPSVIALVEGAEVSL